MSDENLWLQQAMGYQLLAHAHDISISINTRIRGVLTMAASPIAVGAIPVRVNGPNCFHRSTVTTTQPSDIGVPQRKCYAVSRNAGTVGGRAPLMRRLAKTDACRCHDTRPLTVRFAACDRSSVLVLLR